MENVDVPKELKLVAIVSLVMLAVGFRQAEWAKVESAKENFTISMPSEPKRERKRASEGDAFFVLGSDQHIYSVESGGIDYRIETSHFHVAPKRPQDIKMILDFARHDFLRETGYKVRILRDREISLAGFPGWELRAENGKRVRTLRAYMIKDRLYQLTTTEPKAAEQSPDAVKFFESFKLLAQPK
jgi:hypothetical protein